MDTLLCTTKRWLQPEVNTATQVAERVAMDRFLEGLTPEEARTMGMKTATTPVEMIEVLENALSTLEVCRPIQRRSYSDAKHPTLWPTWANTLSGDLYSVPLAPLG